MSHDVKLKAANDWPILQAGQFPTPEIGKIAQNFCANLERVRWNLLLLPWMIGKTALYQDAATRVELSAEDSELAAPDFQTKAQSKIHAITDEDEARCLADIELAFTRDAHALKTVDFLLECYGQPKPDGSKSNLLIGFDAVYQSMITGTWTAFEVMAGDLWETALNLHPVHLASLAKAPGNLEKTIELSQLERNGYDLSKMMGTIHKETGRFRFQVLAGIREAFLSAFRKDGDAVQLAISDQSLDALSLMRNTFVHSAGKTDKKFIDSSGPIAALAKWNSQGIGHHIDLDGEDVSKLISPVVHCSMDLIKAVQTWLTKHP